MKNGFVKVSAVSPEVALGEVDTNVRRLAEAVKQGAKDQVKLLVFPELSMTGYTCGDYFFSGKLLYEVEAGLDDLAQATASLDVLFFVGAPLEIDNKLYNCAVSIQKGNILAVIPKSTIPNYGEFYESRYFAGADSAAVKTIRLGEKDIPFGTDLLLCCRSCKDLKVGVELCEDLWAPLSPSVMHAVNGATVLCNLSASNEYIGKESARRKLIEVTSQKLKCAYLYCSAGYGESSTDLVFDGNKYIAECGDTLKISDKSQPAITALIDLQRIAYIRRKIDTFWSGGQRADYRCVEFDLDEVEYSIGRYEVQQPFLDIGQPVEEICEKALLLQADGLYRRLQATGLDRMVLGVSGGLDSTLTLLVCRNVCDRYGIPATNIMAYSLPCFGTSDRTRNNGERLCRQLGVTFRTISISDMVTDQLKALEHDFSHDITFENAQARQRTALLMNAANQHGGILVGTGDLSELALGFCTYGGDQMAMYNVNASVPKSMVRAIVSNYAEHCGNPELADTLRSVVGTDISPELLPVGEDGKVAQKTEEIVGNYTIIDYVLFHHISYGFSQEKIRKMALWAFRNDFTEAEIKMAVDSFFTRFPKSQFKRSCAPDGVKVTSVSFSPRSDLRLPSDKYSQ